MKSEQAIEVKNLTFKYTEEDFVVLKDNNLILDKGVRCLLVGTNGAGKSTLLRILGKFSSLTAHVKRWAPYAPKKRCVGVGPISILRNTTHDGLSRFRLEALCRCCEVYFGCHTLVTVQ
jgi:energy-coupling factor transporter ATP-binding protein EcfA2